MPATSGTCARCRFDSCTLKLTGNGALWCHECRGEQIHKPHVNTRRGTYCAPRAAPKCEAGPSGYAFRGGRY